MTKNHPKTSLFRHLFLVIIFLNLSACAQQRTQQIENKHMQNQPAIQTPVTTTTANKPITFNEHALDVVYYSASDLKVTYGKIKIRDCEVIRNCNKPARAKTHKDEKRFPGGILGLIAFLGPLHVQWKSQDGMKLSSTLNLEEIFPGKVILHQENPDQLEETLPLITPPTIVVEVNDRTLSIYMYAYMGVKTDEPGRIRRGSRNYTLAYQKTY